MRYVIFIFLLFIFQSCFHRNILKQPSSTDVNQNLIVNSVEDTILFDKKDYNEDNTPLLMSRSDKRELENNQSELENNQRKLENNQKKEDNYKKIDKYNIKNYIDTTTVVNYDMGIIGYNIPGNFKVNEWSTVKLRISRKNKIESIVLGKGSRPIPLTDINSNDEIIIDKVKVDNFMTAKLYSDDNVELKIVTNETQRLSDDGYTEWVWRIKPKTTEHCYIKMVITMSDVDYVVYEEEILVEANWTWSFSNWFSKWWQAITATIITPILIPFIIWFRSKRKRSKESD